MIKNFLLVFIGGGIGSILRYAISHFFNKFHIGNFPWATFIANVLGCALIGFITSYVYKTTPQDDTLKLLLVTGFCGGFTTFSTLSLENYNFIQNNQYFLAFFYSFTSIIIGILAVFIGFKSTN